MRYRNSRSSLLIYRCRRWTYISIKTCATLVIINDIQTKIFSYRNQKSS